MAKPEVATEGVLLWTNEEGQKIQALIGDGLLLHNDIEFSGKVLIGRFDGDIDGTTRIIKVGMDYQTGDFYIAPAIEIATTNIEVESSNAEYEQTGSIITLEGGYRAQNLTVYGQILISSSETDEDLPTVEKNETEGDGIGFGLSYNF